jgi:hypothetical protein
MQQHSPNAPPQFIAMVSGQCNLSGRTKIASTRLLRLSPSCCNLECVDELASNLQFFGKAALPGLLCFGMQVRLSRSTNLHSTITMQIFHGGIANLFVGSEQLFAHSLTRTYGDKL